MNKKALDKIKKCLDLAKSTNPNEAANALNKAKLLMKKYGLNNDDVEFIEMGKTTTSSCVPDKLNPYVWSLIHSIANNFQTLSIHNWEYNDTKGKHEGRITFIGSAHAAALSAYSFDVLYRELMKARLEYVKKLHHRLKRINKTIRANEYCKGWVESVTSKLTYQHSTEEHTEKLKNFQRNLYPDTVEATELVRKEGREQDYLKGLQDGHSISVHDPVSGQETKKLSNY